MAWREVCPSPRAVGGNVSSKPVAINSYMQNPSGIWIPMKGDVNGNLLVSTATSLVQASDYPSGATPISASSGNVANAAATATLAGTVGKTTYIVGFVISGSGATAGLPVIVTITNLIGGTMSFIYSAAVGVLVENTPLICNFTKPIPANAVNTNIVVSCPALGTGNTNNTANAWGYQL